MYLIFFLSIVFNFTLLVLGVVVLKHVVGEYDLLVDAFHFLLLHFAYVYREHLYHFGLLNLVYVCFYYFSFFKILVSLFNLFSFFLFLLYHFISSLALLYNDIKTLSLCDDIDVFIFTFVYLIFLFMFLFFNLLTFLSSFI